MTCVWCLTLIPRSRTCCYIIVHSAVSAPNTGSGHFFEQGSSLTICPIRHPPCRRYNVPRRVPPEAVAMQPRAHSPSCPQSAPVLPAFHLGGISSSAPSRCSASRHFLSPSATLPLTSPSSRRHLQMMERCIDAGMPRRRTDDSPRRRSSTSLC